MTDHMDPHRAPLRAVRVSGASHRERGLARGTLLGEQVLRTSRAYAGLFGHLGIAERDQREAALASMDAVRAWAPEVHEELEGVAAGSGTDLLDVARTVARTEILTLAQAPVATECSTLAHVPAPTDRSDRGAVSAQTWDWYARFVGCWHLHRVDPVGEELAHAGIAEHGMTGKIGLNAAGVGVHLNILQHHDDAPGGVPVHVVLARLLTGARSVQEGLDLVRSAPTTSSSVITLTGTDRVAMAELSPGRVTVLEEEGWMLHTNHFLGLDEPVRDPASTTHDRLGHLRGATGPAPAPRSADDLLPLLCVPPGPGSVAVLPDLSEAEADRKATLATVRIDPGARTVRVSPGIPQHADEVCLTYQL
ncbi:C45 family autoproteolytic acyltransferase/hydolase [Ornithinimicrobium avium]|uniref:Isopenicillin acyltransferase n=1 Tax=Ornithinimicrobium avium TaxID=2283195 RepID=A0A345NK72_9MICO|nr:C45 family peptidase [Ornithinimicrobium avium]AXH95430.1 isopenicillin acyltransferase [Ornithinimicrobium avium]